MQNVTDVSTYTAVIQCPQDGDAANGANTKVGFQGLANRTARHQEALTDQQDLNDANYDSLTDIRTYAVKTVSTALLAGSVNFGAVTLSPGEVLIPSSDTGLTGLSGIINSDTFEFNTASEGWFEFSLHALLTAIDGADFAGFERVTVELVKNGSVLRTWYGMMGEQGATMECVVTGTHLVVAEDGDEIQIRYASANLGNVGITGVSHLVVTQRYSFTSNTPPAAPTAPTDLIDP
jgi:hypothetical protein